MMNKTDKNKNKNDNSPFINKYQPIYFNDFEQLDATVVTLMQSLIMLNNFDYHSTGDESLIKSFCIGMLDEHLQKISNTRKNSLRFGL